MARVKVIRSRGTVERFSDASALLNAPGDYVYVVRGVPRSIVMQCPDGCGEVITVNLDRRTGPAWRLFKQGDRVTIYPSVWKETGCKAHFIVWNNRLLWCDLYERANWENESLVAAVRRALPRAGSSPVHFEEVALQLEAVPWEALWACQTLERRGEAISSARGTKFAASSGRQTSPTSIDVLV